MFKIKPKLNKEKNDDVKKVIKNKPGTQLQTKQTTVLARKKPIIEEKDKDESNFYAISYRLMAKRVKFLFPRLISLEPKIRQAGMPVHYEAYVCAIVLVSFVMGIVGLVAGAAVSLIVKLDPPAFGYLLPIILGSALSQGAFGIMYMLPRMSIKSRTSKISNELPYYIGYMATLSASGLSSEGVFKAIARDEDSKEELVQDARVLVRNIELLGMDILTAIKDLIKRAPPGPYSDLLEGLISTVESGGDMKSYFIATAKVQMEEKKLMLKKATESLGMLAEIYTILLIVFPLLGVIIFSIMAIMTPSLGGMSLTTLMKGLAYVMVPLFGVMLLIMMDSMVPKR